MQNERDVEFTPSPGLGATTGGVEFTPSPGIGTPTGDTGGQAQAGGTVQQAKERAQQLAGEAQQRTAEQVQSRLHTQKQQAAESLRSVAQSLRASGQQFQGQQDSVSRYAHQAADQVEDLAYYLQDRDIGEIVDDAEDFARRNSAVFLGGAFALGVLGARFLKSSRRNLVREGVRERWSTRELTSRVDDPERDAVGRPRAPGYAPPSQRTGSEYGAAGAAGPRNL